MTGRRPVAAPSPQRSITGFVGPQRLPAGTGTDPDGVVSAYAEELRRSLAGRRDVDDLVDEVVDHLLESATRLERAGATPSAAAAESVARFGDRDVVARAYRTTLSGGHAVPTPFTRLAGAAGLLAAAGVVALLVMQVVDVREVYSGRFSSAFGEEGWFGASAFSLVTLVVLVAGLALRTGAAQGAWTVVMVLALVAALGVGLYLWWASPLWGCLVSVGCLVVASRAHARSVRSDGGAPWALWCLVAAWPAGTGVLLALEPLDLGRVDMYGQHVLHFLAALGVTTALLVPAALRLGWWMVREASVAHSTVPPLARA